MLPASSDLAWRSRSGSPRRRTLLVAAVAIQLGVPAVAVGQSSPQAEQLFRDGRRLMAERKYAEACAAFDASQRVEPTVATAMNLADCSEKAGMLATAWGWFLDVAAKTRASATGSALHETARRRAAAIEPRLSYLVVRVPDEARTEGLVITLDRTVLSAGAWSREVPIDGGGHTIEVTAPGRAAWSARVTVGNERDRASVDVPILAPAPVAMAAPPAVVARTGAAGAPVQVAQARVAAVEHARSSGGRSLALPIALGAGAIAAVLGGVALEVSAERSYDRSVVEADDARQHALYDAAVQRRAGAIGLGVAGVVAGGVAIYLLVRGQPEPVVVPTGNGIAIAGVF